MSRHFFFCCILFSSLIQSCSNSSSKKPVFRDTSITAATSFNDLFMDSLELDQFLKNNTAYQDYTKQFNDFYKDRNYAYAWFDSSGLSEQASNFRNLQLNYISSFEDSSLYHPEMEQLLQRLVSSNKKNKPADSLVLKAELLLTGQFFRYAAKVYK